MKTYSTEAPKGLAAAIVSLFIDSKLTPLIILASMLLGIGAILRLPREEEPQIVVPMMDIFLQMPGASAKEVEHRVTRPLEKLIWEIPGVEYLYSTSSENQALLTVRFEVGHQTELALVQLQAKIMAHLDRIPPGVSLPLIKVRSIDDVPILALTFHSQTYDALDLRRIVVEIEDTLKQVEEVSETTVLGGLSRKIYIIPNRLALAARSLSLNHLVSALKQANQALPAGSYLTENTEILLETGAFLQEISEIQGIVIGVYENKPVFVRDVAEVQEKPEEPEHYVWFLEGAGSKKHTSSTSLDKPFRSAVTLAIAKRQGTNAIDIAERVLEKLEHLKKYLVPQEVEITVMRHYGQSAKEKSDELLFHMAIAVVSVSLLIGFFLGWREACVVAIAIPVTLALTLLAFYLFGFTLNRITLFALIFSIGILVDDPIVDVENIVRHLRLPHSQDRPLMLVAQEAVNEVRSPLILATLTVIVAILPMSFVRGLMGPYMRPIPVGATSAMIFSMFVAFVITPWAAVRLLNKTQNHSPEGEKEDALTLLYRKLMGFLIHHRFWQFLFLAFMLALLLGTLALVPLGFVRIKMLPFDNKNEFQVVVDLPESATLEQTNAVCMELAGVLAEEPEIEHLQVYAGLASPYNFNGLVRHYFLRKSPFMGDLQVHLVSKHERKKMSHEIAVRVRPLLERVAQKYGAKIKVAEVPPGPPVLQTLVAEVYGPDLLKRNQLAQELETLFRQTEGIVDVDTSVEKNQKKIRLEIDREKAGLHGIDTERISQNLQTAVQGTQVGILHDAREREDVALIVRFSEEERHSFSKLLMLPLISHTGAVVPLGELVRVQETVRESRIFHKNLRPVSYVMAEVTGDLASPAYAILALKSKMETLKAQGESESVDIYFTQQPKREDRYGIKWDGEIHITYEVFRDLGFAFLVVLLLIYVLVVSWFESFKTPWVILSAIPFSLVGILPAHALLGAFFGAPSMIGFIAGAGIVVRNSIILVDFIELRLKEGRPLSEAVIDAGAIRFRPMLLTATAVIVGAGIILFDPIFQGLALSLMAGEVASLLLSRMAVPVLYFLSISSKTEKT
jgi:multidrug efflux pump subunit AcrB